MHTEFMRSDLKAMPAFNNPSEVRSLRIWHCKFESLSGLQALQNLQTLVIATFPDHTLEALDGLSNLKFLSIMHLPNVSDLAPLASLHALESLSLSTLPSWDSSGKLTTVESLRPLGCLSRLQHVELFGVVPRDLSLVPLEQCKALESARFSKYPKQEVERFLRATKVSDAHVPEPIMG